jgi:hypothetical protein
VGASGGAGRRARPPELGASSETTRGRFWPGFRVGAPSAVDFGHSDGCDVGVGEPTILLGWLVQRSFRLGPAPGAVPSGRRVAGPQLRVKFEVQH